MSIISPPAKVLVTGANGFLAAWILHFLLEHGYSVRGTVRAESKSEYLRNLYKSEVENQQLEFIVVPDMMSPGAFDDAVKGAHAIVHTASPVHLDANDPNELIEPAVTGTLGVLESALKYANSRGEQLKRVVITSSCAAVVNIPYSGIFDERSWNEGAIMEVQEKGKGASQLAKYRASKTLAERAAWDFVERNRPSINWDLATICPPYIFGPVLLSPHSRPTELSASMSLFYKALFSKSIAKEELKGMQGEWVDVRDVAEGHVRALEVSQAGGERFILSSGPWMWQNWFDVANQLDIPDADFPIGTPGEGKQFSFKVRFDPKKARSTLGLQFRDMGQTTRDVVKDFVSRGWVSLGAS
ncbi:hypothetical protein ACEPAG_9155 [Sanghuangporus baumii]